jgi:hypothetical protein
MCADKFNFTLEPSGTNIDKAWEYKFSEGAKICITPTSPAELSVTGDHITITFADGSAYVVVPSMGQGGQIREIYTNGTSVYINFTCSLDVNPTFSYIIQVPGI